MFVVPGSTVKAVNIDEETVRGKQQPRYEYLEEEGEGEGSDELAETEDLSNESRTQEEVGVALEQSTVAKAKV